MPNDHLGPNPARDRIRGERGEPPMDSDLSTPSQTFHPVLKSSSFGFVNDHRSGGHGVFAKPLSMKNRLADWVTYSR